MPSPPPSLDPAERQLRSNFAGIHAAFDTLESAVSLYNHCEGQLPHGPRTLAEMMEGAQRRVELVNWQNIAARAGALSIFEFAMVSRASDALIAKTQALSARVDRDAQREASKLFASAFPDFEGVRHVAAHGSELVTTLEKTRDHAGVVSIAGHVEGPMLLLGAIIDGEYVSTFKGKTARYGVTDDTVKLLRDVLILRAKALSDFGPMFSVRR